MVLADRKVKVRELANATRISTEPYFGQNSADEKIILPILEHSKSDHPEQSYIDLK